MWWEFKLLLSVGIVALGIAICRCNDIPANWDARAKWAQYFCAAVVFGVLLWFVWGPRPIWDESIFGRSLPRIER